MTPIKIAIVDDHTLFRQGIGALLKEHEEIQIVFEAGNGKLMQQALTKQPLPDVILMDINMPVMDGYASTAWLKANHPGVAVLALSMYEDDNSVIKMIKHGAGGYVLKECRPTELLGAIVSLKERGLYLNEMVSGKMFRSFNKADDAQISTKELEFMKWCCSELTYKEIADKMFVSPRTVDSYRESLFQKLNLKSRVGLVLYAIKNSFFLP
ncbi:response regulator transcription factor [Mucilaginibacter sp. ZT4R22]|uniref:Response regulator transcription factor n=1 Tax=Mucilaginibacter pankratovii TaxID=2772110 RepID=A0ABR7WLN7_9SPHI|nr:response regulator transcription factor [Mucilaginibacter pankratovii]MBD1362392.1 response regulator transcription factor [Mucilaginibacter pankratovii]